jgi:hypothetical protein
MTAGCKGGKDVSIEHNFFYKKKHRCSKKAEVILPYKLHFEAFAPMDVGTHQLACLQIPAVNKTYRVANSEAVVLLVPAVKQYAILPWKLGGFC